MRKRKINCPKGHFCIRIPSRQWFKRFTIRLAALTGVGIMFYFVFRHWHVPGIAALTPGYLAERLAFEWLGDAAAESTVETSV